ncbi:MAG: glycosyltransferase [Candidatus Aenigmarchaeota archaeon]|nr:glycosyltransferase [Candidatus Aenigmarchaeota archaeon]
MNPRFSFIIPTLNEGKYIGDCIKSIKTQSLQDYEIIVVDSYSKDDTVKLAKDFGANVLMESKKGPGAARNTGAKQAKGSMLIFADADVRFAPDFLHEFSLRFGKAGGCIFNLHAHDARSASEASSYLWVSKIARFFISLGIPFTAGSCFAYKKEVFSKVGGFNESFLTNEDHELAKRVSRIQRFIFMDVPVFTSARRSQKTGFLKITRIYAKSTLTYFLNNRYISGYW